MVPFPRFVALLCLPRSGSSLLMDLIRLCGWHVADHISAGSDASLREGRNEFLGVAQPVLPGDERAYQKQLLAALQDTGCEALKVVHNHDVIMPALVANVEDLRVVFLTRNSEAMAKSQADYGIATSAPPLVLEERLATIRQRYVEGAPPYRVHAVAFEKLMAQDRPTLAGLRDFLGGTAPLDALAAVIHPEVVKHGW